MKLVQVAVILGGLGGTAWAGVFDGFGGREDAYLVGADRICKPIVVEGGVARGAPACHKAPSDEIAQLSVKAPKPERGAKVQFAAAAKGRTLTVTRPDGAAAVVTWESVDPISKVVDVYASTYGNVVAVEMMVSRGGRDQADVVAFDLRGAGGATTGTGTGTEKPSTGTEKPSTGTETPGTSTSTSTEKTPESPALAKALAAARKTKGKAALAAWAKVTAVDADNSEARYGAAVALAAQKKPAEAQAALDALAKSRRADAIEFLVAARFDPAFAALRADAAFRKAVGLDRPAATFYERIMGMGGTWEQPGTSCDAPGVTLTLARDRTFTLRVKSACEGDKYDDKFGGRWDIQDPQLVLSLPNPESGGDSFPCAVEPKAGEDAIHCALSEDLEFTVRPVRR